MNILLKKTIFIVSVSLFFATATQLSAQNIKLRTRAVIDLGYFGYDTYDDQLYPSISDFRIGASFKRDNLSFKADFGISGKQISMKDVFVDWKINDKNSIRFGHGFEAMSTEILTSSLDIPFNNFSLATSALTTGRRLGATYMHNSDCYHGAVGVYSDNNANALFDPVNTSNAFSMSTRHLYRNSWNKKSFLQLGGAVSLRNIDQRTNYSEPAQFEFATGGFADLLGVEMQTCIVNLAKANVKTAAELLGTFGRFRVQAEYIASCVTRNQSLTGTTPDAYIPHGGYAQFSYLLGKNVNYNYDRHNAVSKASDVGSIELNARIDYLNLNSKGANIYKGEQTNITMGANWRLHKLCTIKWNVNYAFNDKYCNPDFSQNGFSTIARVQFYY